MTGYSETELDPVLKTVVSHWLKKIAHARDHKREVFQKSADECQSFYSGPKDWRELMGACATDDRIDLQFEVSVNKTFEFVTIFGPAMYYENPVRTVKPRMPVIVPPQFFPDPMLYQALWQAENQRVMVDGLRSVLLESTLNYTPVEFTLGTEARKSIDEALIKGRGCLWTELYQPPGSPTKVVRSLHDTTDNLLCDPDAPSFEEATWIARRCVHPTWQVERDFGLRRGSIKGNAESQARQSDIQTDDDEYMRKTGQTNDLLVYWKIYSKMGIGGRLKGFAPGLAPPLEMFGDYVYLAVADNVPFPLNLCPDDTNDPSFGADPKAVFAKVAWPTPFWGKNGAWPVTVLDFHLVDKSPWPMPHLKAGIGELRFLNWCMSFLMGKVRTSTRDFLAVLKSASDELKTAILEGKDFTLLEIEGDHKDINEIVQFLQHPPVNGDIWKMIEAVEANFDKRVGLTELMYGQQGATQIRSAEEANLRSSNMNVRPDDMRKQVEAWMSAVSAKEAVCSRYHLVPDDVKPVLGGMGSWAWGQFVYTQDVNEACRQLEYRIESGSTSRPNREYQITQMNQAFQTLSPTLTAYSQQTGDMTPMNALITDWCKANDLDPARYTLKAAPVPPQANPADDQGGGAPQGSTQNSQVPS